MNGVQFAGNALSVADSKGRFTLPLILRSQIRASFPVAEDGSQNNKFYVMADESITVVRALGETQRQDMVEELLRDEANAVARGLPFDRKFESRRRFSTLEPITYDDGGRFFLSDTLREYAGITDKIMFVGAFSAIELWEPEHLLATDVQNPGLHIAVRKALELAAQGKSSRKGSA